jgi:uncharacterized protein (DUF58 family)
MLLDEALLHKLERVSLTTRHVRAGQTRGERRSTKRGTSVEFADYRDYSRGDDLRRVDWNAYARLERPYVKLFEEEEDLAVHLLLDASGSMDWGAEEGPDVSPRASTSKWEYTCRLAAALGYIALKSGDRLSVASLSSNGSGLFGPIRGRGNLLRLLEWLGAQRPAGRTDLDSSLGAYALRAGRPGLAILISDMLSPSGYAAGLSALAARGHEVVLLHSLSRDEVDPPLAGDLRLLDVETGGTAEITIDGASLALYRKRLAAWRQEVGAACRARSAHYLPFVTDDPLEMVLLRNMRSLGVLR